MSLSVDTIRPVMEVPKIEWSEATVTESGDSVTLIVGFDAMPSDDWAGAFEELVTARNPQARSHPWREVQFFDGKITVGGIEAGREDQLADYLDGLVATTNQRLEKKRQRDAEAEQDRTFRSEAMAKEAARMQERIRNRQTD